MSCPFPFSLFSLEAMGCCGINGSDAKEEAEEEKRAKKTNKDIERQIQKDKQVNLTILITDTLTDTSTDPPILMPLPTLIQILTHQNRCHCLY